ncbi:hypothetical protein EGI22_03525 [Lacihabitans sp. LS3-19]|nr:hypothetical protein [Lacihabitans sp. LS3-19]
MLVCCPDCKTVPSTSEKSLCFCGENFNHFKNQAKCPSCGYQHEFTECLNINCKSIALHLDWYPTIKSNLRNLQLNLDLILS